MSVVRASRLIQNLNEINMNILLIQKVDLTERWKANNVTSSFTRIYMVTEGEGYLYHNGKETAMKPGGIYVIPAGLNMSYMCKNFLKKVYFHLSLPLNNNLDLFNGVNDIYEFYEPDIIDTVLKSFNGETATSVLKMKAVLYDILGRCTEQSKKIELHKYSDYVSEIIAYTEKNLSASLTVDEIADALFTSSAKLRKLFAKETGQSIGKYIDERLMFVAELLVRSNGSTIKEISDRLGFCDQFYFSRCFSRKYGMSPLRYRKEQVYKNN